MKYPKINSLYKRDEKTHKFILDSYSAPEFELIDLWDVEEKIDGMNMRINVNRESNYDTFGIYGRTDDASIPPSLLNYMNKLIEEKLDLVSEYLKNPETYILFGEGYGPKIQRGGGNYRDDQGFILFDVWSGHRWSTREEVKVIADLMEIPVPFRYGLMSLNGIISLVKEYPDSPSAIRKMTIEGVMCRSEPLLINNYSRNRVMFKLKCKDLK